MTWYMSVRPSHILTGRKKLLRQPWFYNYEFLAFTGLACRHTD